MKLGMGRRGERSGPGDLNSLLCQCLAGPSSTLCLSFSVSKAGRRQGNIIVIMPAAPFIECCLMPGHVQRTLI